MAKKSQDKLYKRKARSKNLDYKAWSQTGEDSN